MTNQQGVPEALRLADALEFRTTSWPDKVFAAAELRRLHALTEIQQQELISESHRTAEQKLRADQMTRQHADQAAMNREARAKLAALVDAQQPATHVQNPAGIEHVAGDVSKNEPESNMAQQPAPSAAAFDEHGFRDWVLRNLPKGSIIGNGEWWADHLTSWAKRFVKAAPQPSPTPQADSVPSRFGSPELQAMILARCVEKDQADSVLEDAALGIDAAFEAVRRGLCKLPRYSFYIDTGGGVRKVGDRIGKWIEFDEAHALFDPISVDAARKQGGA